MLLLLEELQLDPVEIVLCELLSLSEIVTAEVLNLKPEGTVRITLPVEAFNPVPLTSTPDRVGPVREVQVSELTLSAEMELPPVAAVSVASAAPAG